MGLQLKNDTYSASLRNAEPIDHLALEARAWSTLMRDTLLYRTESSSGTVSLDPQVTEAMAEGLYRLVELTDQMCRQS